MNTPAAKKSSVVQRSVVPNDLKYLEYKTYLRRDFFFSCAYCTMSESEARAIRFTIDHYEPKTARRDLEHDYRNLMYACDNCNMYKGDRNPPPAARTAGHRFFRADQDEFDDHFVEAGIRIEGRTNTGKFTVEFADLNRLGLRRLRELRQRLYDVDEYVSEGLRGLRRIHFDRLPKAIKRRAQFLRLEAERNAKALAEAIDEYLAVEASSPLLDEDQETQARAKDRSDRQEELRRVYPGSWRTRG